MELKLKLKRQQRAVSRIETKRQSGLGLYLGSLVAAATISEASRAVPFRECNCCRCCPSPHANAHSKTSIRFSSSRPTSGPISMDRREDAEWARQRRTCVQTLRHCSSCLAGTRNQLGRSERRRFKLPLPSNATEAWNWCGVNSIKTPDGSSLCVIDEN